MPLPPSIAREQMHVRSVALHGYRRADGLFDIEGRLTDVKDHPLLTPAGEAPLPPGVPVHDMSIRLVIDEDMRIAELAAVIDAGPYADCPHATGSIAALRGVQIGPGWTARVKALLGAQSCTHLVELLVPMGTAAYQTLAPVRFSRADIVDTSGRPRKIDSCYAFAAQRTLVKKIWPAHYTGPDAEQAAPRQPPPLPPPGA